MEYERSILKVLLEAGPSGLRTKLLILHVYNMHITLFETPDIDKISQKVRAYLSRHSKGKRPILETTEAWGGYRIRPRERWRVVRKIEEADQDS